MKKGRKASPRTRFSRQDAGATAAEFALVLVPLIGFTLGTINVALMIYTVATLHSAVEDTARYAMINKNCSSSSAIQRYAASRYLGPGASEIFTCSTTNSNCLGSEITGTVNYNFTAGMISRVIPLSASACYPSG
jgi:Flp pilus assembly protein TadG